MIPSRFPPAPMTPVSLHTPESPMGGGLSPTPKHQKMQELKTLLSSSETPSPTTTTHVHGSSRNHDQDFIPVVIRSSFVYLSMPPQQRQKPRQTTALHSCFESTVSLGQHMSSTESCPVNICQMEDRMNARSEAPINVSWVNLRTHIPDTSIYRSH